MRYFYATLQSAASTSMVFVVYSQSCCCSSCVVCQRLLKALFALREEKSLQPWVTWLQTTGSQPCILSTKLKLINSSRSARIQPCFHWLPREIFVDIKGMLEFCFLQLKL